MPTRSSFSDPIRCQPKLSLRTYPVAVRASHSLQTIARAQIDLSTRIHTPDTLFHVKDIRGAGARAAAAAAAAEEDAGVLTLMLEYAADKIAWLARRRAAGRQWRRGIEDGR
ncbi:hypothetical protein VTO73DRAFT_2636 [Trametes versicolor]